MRVQQLKDQVSVCAVQKGEPLKLLAVCEEVLERMGCSPLPCSSAPLSIFNEMTISRELGSPHEDRCLA